MEEMRGRPVALVRPLAVIGGWRSPPLMSRTLARRLCALTSRDPNQILSHAYPWAGSIEGASDHLRRRLIPWLDALGTRELDVVAISMGGLVSRHLACSEAWGGRGDRFRIHRLLTISTPHQGAQLARWFKIDRAARCMSPGSAMLSVLDDALNQPGDHADALTCYVQRLDWFIGTWNAAPPGRELRWVHPPNPLAMCMSHFTAHLHRAIIADIARRLRGEDPLQTTVDDGRTSSAG